MTLPTSKHLDEAHNLYSDHPKMHQAIRMIRESQHAASTQPLLAEIERLKGENEDLSNERDRAVEGLLRFVAHPDAEDGADGALCALVARAEAEAQKLREALAKYGQCLSTCATQGQFYPARFNMNYCDCGLRKALGGS